MPLAQAANSGNPAITDADNKTLQQSAASLAADIQRVQRLKQSNAHCDVAPNDSSETPQDAEAARRAKLARAAAVAAAARARKAAASTGTDADAQAATASAAKAEPASVPKQLLQVLLKQSQLQRPRPML